MKSAARGKNTSAVEVTNVSSHGFWLLVQGQEHFVSFKDFPWFRDTTIAELSDVQLPSVHHLYWPSLDVDLALESLVHPERYPLVSRQGITKKPKDRKNKTKTSRKSQKRAKKKVA